MPIHATMPALPVKSSGEAIVCVVDDDILSVAFSGHVDNSVTRQGVVRARQVLGGRRFRAMLCDTMGITTLDMSAREPGREILVLAREHGVREIFCAAPSPAVRMLGVALGLAVGVRIHFFSTIAEARASAGAAASAEDRPPRGVPPSWTCRVRARCALLVGVTIPARTLPRLNRRLDLRQGGRAPSDTLSAEWRREKNPR